MPPSPHQYDVDYTHPLHLQAHGRQLQLEAPSSTYNRSAYGCQRHAVYDDPWVKDNVAFTYAVIIRDGLGGQTTRIIAVYALAAAMGVGYVHSPLSCIGHIGGFPHWRNRTCDNVDPADKAKMQRISKFLMLPNTTKQDTSSWRQELFMKGSWEMLANVTETALRLQQPTVIRIEWVHNFLSDCPDLFFHVPSWRPSSTSVPQVGRLLASSTTVPAVGVCGCHLIMLGSTADRGASSGQKTNYSGRSAYGVSSSGRLSAWTMVPAEIILFLYPCGGLSSVRSTAGRLNTAWAYYRGCTLCCCC